MQDFSGPTLVDKVRKMFEELEHGLRPGAIWLDEQQAQVQAEQRIKLAEELLMLGPRLSGAERGACPDPLVRGYLASDLWWRLQYHVQRGLGGWMDDRYSPGSLRRNVSNNPDILKHIKLALPDLNRYLADDMKDDSAFRSSALMFRCNCYRALAQYEMAIRDAVELVSTEQDGDAFALLSQCYFDIGDYEKAKDAATQAILRARNDIFRCWAWGNRAEIHRTFGNQAAYEYDKQQRDEFCEKARQKT